MNKIGRRRALTVFGSALVAGCPTDFGPSDDSRPRTPEPLEWTVEDGPADVTADPDERPAPGSWPMAGYDAAGTGAAPAENAPEGFPLERTWIHTTAEHVLRGPVVADGTVLAQTAYQDSILFAVDTDGEERWSVTRDDLGHAAPAIAGDTGVVPRGYLETGEYLDGVSLSDGGRRWRHELPEAVSASPVVAGDTVFAGRGFDATALAIDARSGDLGVRLTLSGSSIEVVRVAVADGRAYVGVKGSDTDYPNLGWVLAFDPNAGAVEWVYPADAPVADLAVRDGSVYVVNREGLASLDADSGELEWDARDEEIRDAESVAVTEDTVFAGSTERVFAFGTDAGDRRWTAPVGGSNVLAVAGETVFTGGRRLDADTWAFAAFATEDGRERWRYDRNARPTGGAVAAGRFFVGTERGTLHCFG
ncbi:PQQ-binding-like beta-propeller repeat protein [Halosimplex pelagicum]|uniref:PQQ-binding-like beta-propeller repeat protein n=1 Tax=Halosimplex pelagicum TaxID=869886 RepID=A0A7D5P8V2_9EURY|nr:PQQ-binding-like beta-propeller repeat protein [Halosimplex pelagicum]QLH80138.1 PQQ-binding-like beta-propeller repeat protein [Halosimplex pelagicum]